MQIRHLIIGYSFLLIFSAACVYIFGLEIFVNIWVGILGYSVIVYVFYFLWKKIRFGKHVGYIHFFTIFIYRVAIFTSIFLMLTGGFILYQNKLNPATLPYYVLTDGEKTIKFQTMSHIASPSFYTHVRDDIHAAKKDGYVLYYEGVRPGTQENMNTFNKALGVELNEGTYDRLSELYGIVAQDNSYFLGLVNNKDKNVDLDINEIVEIYKQNTTSSENGEKTRLQKITSAQESYDIDAYIDSLSQKEKDFLKYINQAFMNMIIKNGYIRTGIMKALGNDDIFAVILDDRNAHLVRAITQNPETDIFIIYGLMHFDGVFELLKAENPSWEIVKTGDYRVIDSQW